MKSNKGFNLVSVIIIICITSIISGITTGIIATNSYKNSTGISYNDLLNDQELSNFLEVYSSILSNYYEDVNKEEMLDSAVDAMLNYLGDTYTSYLNSQEREALEERLKGTYEGIGIKISGNSVYSVIDDSPAQKAGILAGDIIVKVNDTDVTEKSGDEISNLIKKSGKDKVELVIHRNETELHFSLNVVDNIISPAINYKMLDNSIGYIQMELFSKTLSSQVEKAIANLKNQGMQKLIIDLRDNTGGYLESAEETANLFLDKGMLIYSLEDKDDKEDYYDKTNASTDFPIVILINGTSASASEILAAALKDSYGAILVGEKSYGKGKVQQTYQLSDGSMAKLTSAKWLRPNGECIDGIGLIPDYEVSLVQNDNGDGGSEMIDTQLSKAIEVINAMINN